MPIQILMLVVLSSILQQPQPQEVYLIQHPEMIAQQTRIHTRQQTLVTHLILPSLHYWRAVELAIPSYLVNIWAQVLIKSPTVNQMRQQPVMISLIQTMRMGGVLRAPSYRE